MLQIFWSWPHLYVYLSVQIVVHFIWNVCRILIHSKVVHGPIYAIDHMFWIIFIISAVNLLRRNTAAQICASSSTMQITGVSLIVIVSTCTRRMNLRFSPRTLSLNIRGAESTFLHRMQSSLISFCADIAFLSRLDWYACLRGHSNDPTDGWKKALWSIRSSCSL